MGRKQLLKRENYFSQDKYKSDIINFLREILQNDLKNSNQQLGLGVGVSGGPDSVFLLYFLKEIFFTQDFIVNLIPIYFNHNLRGHESSVEAKFVKNLCHSWGLDLQDIDLDVKQICKEKKIGIEAGARYLRYMYFEKIHKRLKLDYICLGHHLDDRIETVFFNIMRGSGIWGLSSIKSKRDIYLRPLLNYNKKEILNFLNDNDIKFCIDSSNKHNLYSRNIIRNELIPKIESSLERNIKPALLRLSDTCLEMTDFIKDYINNFVIKYTYITKEIVIIKKDAFFSEKKIIQKEILNDLSQRLGFSYNIEGKHLNILLKHLFLSKGKCLNHKKVSFSSFQNTIILGKIRLEEIKEQLINISQSFFYNNDMIGQFIISENSEYATFCMDKCSIEGSLMIKNIEENDHMITFGLNKKQKVNKLFSDKKIPLFLRKNMFKICDSKKIIYIPGLGLDYRSRITNPLNQKLYIREKNVIFKHLFLS